MTQTCAGPWYHEPSLCMGATITVSLLADVVNTGINRRVPDGSSKYAEFRTGGAVRSSLTNPLPSITSMEPGVAMFASTEDTTGPAAWIIGNTALFDAWLPAQIRRVKLPVDPTPEGNLNLTSSVPGDKSDGPA